MIITVPHKTLRQQAKEIIRLDENLVNFVAELEDTLLKKNNPKGVGLSAPQIDKSLRVFSTLLEPSDENKRPNRSKGYDPIIRSFINPEITSTSEQKTFGEDLESPILEGCLSIPFLYGPVPRWESITFSFQVIEDGKMVKREETFQGFTARVMQHEYDHLEGILFTDYILKYDLPLYEDKSGKMKKIKNTVAKKF